MSHNSLVGDWRVAWLMSCQIQVRAECRLRNGLVQTDGINFSLEGLRGNSVRL